MNVKRWEIHDDLLLLVVDDWPRAVIIPAGRRRRYLGIGIIGGPLTEMRETSKARLKRKLMQAYARWAE